MSQLQNFEGANNPLLADIETISGNSGGPAGPDGSGNFSLTGDNATGIDVVTNPGTFSGLISGIAASTTQVGTSEFADGTETTTGTDGTRSVTPLGLASKLGAQTSHGIPYGNGTAGAIQWLGEAQDGYFPIGQTGGVPVLGTLTSNDGSVNISLGAGTIDLSVASQLSGTATTIGAVTGDVVTFPLGATPGVYALEGRVAGFESSTPAGAGFQIFATVRTDGANATLVGVPDIVSNNEAALVAAMASVVVSGNNAILQVTGVALLTIDWKGDLAYTFRS